MDPFSEAKDVCEPRAPALFPRGCEVSVVAAAGRKTSNAERINSGERSWDHCEPGWVEN